MPVPAKKAGTKADKGQEGAVPAGAKGQGKGQVNPRTEKVAPAVAEVEEVEGAGGIGGKAGRREEQYVPAKAAEAVKKEVDGPRPHTKTIVIPHAPNPKPQTPNPKPQTPPPAHHPPPP